MARQLEFIHAGQSFHCAINKVDREKLYGSKIVETRDLEGNLCTLVTLANDGKTLIPNGGTAFGYVNDNGEWIDRGDLLPVDEDGQALNAMPSSFKMPTELEQTATIERFLEHDVRLCYHLTSETDLPETFVSEVRNGTIFRAPFSYRGGVDPDTAFILADINDEIWMLVAAETDVEMVGLQQAAMCGSKLDEDDDDGSAETDDSLDFGMI